MYWLPLRLLLCLLCIGTIFALPTTTPHWNNPETSPESNPEIITSVATPTTPRNTTKPNPIRQLVKDLFTLYDAVSGFVKPWFADSETTSNKPKIEETTNEPQFDDFDDPGERNETEARTLEEIQAETFLRYVRSVNQTSLIELAKHVSDSYHEEKRRKRDVMDSGDVLKWIARTFIRQARTLWEQNVPEVTRHIRDVWDSNGFSFLSQARAVWQGRETISDLINSLVRLTRDASERVAGKDRVMALERHIRQVQQGRQNLFEGYYDFAINEWSYKFWAVYMLGATALLTYSAIAAIYYGKFNTNAIDYEQYDDLARSQPGASSNPLGLVGSLVSVNTFQKIMEALTSNKYS
ncbi:hypothetical protein B566_EDAN003135 [Ephemera danica]|nr:hypothetical protein B566_EDAN003135 [Ephemera danica]